MLVFKMRSEFIPSGEGGITIVAGHRQTKMLLFHVSGHVPTAVTLKPAVRTSPNLLSFHVTTLLQLLCHQRIKIVVN